VDSTVIVAILLAGVLPVAIVVWALWYMRGDTSRIKNGIGADAVVESLAETGTTISSPALGPDAPVFQFGLLVTPPDGPPYRATSKHAVPRMYVPLVMPGSRIGVLIDPRNPLRVIPDLNKI
jgi:hypothetical protein